LEHTSTTGQRAVPQRLRDELAGVVAATDRLDQQMEQPHRDSRDRG
jgi:hypothetical protein